MRQWLELAGLDADQLAVCQLNLETTVDVHRHDVRRVLWHSRVEMSGAASVSGTGQVGQRGWQRQRVVHDPGR